MPRKAKDVAILNEEKNVKRASVNNEKVKIEKSIVKNSTAKNTREVTAKKNNTVTSKKARVSKVESLKELASTKRSTTSKNSVSKTTRASNSKKSTSKTTTRATSKKSKKSIDILEYYDLPYRYNETIVKVLVQTPSILFVYWDISDNDKENYISKYGEYFFNDTKPVLIVYNDTLNYSFEVDINDFANSWYLHVPDSNCTYRAELGRRPINKYAKIDNYLYISSSNNMIAPNDHILFDSLNNNVYFRNVKTNASTKKDISLSFFSKIGKIYNVQNFYKTMYKDEDIDFDRLSFRNVSSS